MALAAGIIVFAAIIAKNDFKVIVDNVISFGVFNIIILCATQSATLVLINFQWKRILAGDSTGPSAGVIVKMNMTGSFFEAITPAVKVGGEVSRGIFLKNHTNLSGAEAAGAVAAQKLISMAAFAATCFVFSSSYLLFGTDNGRFFAIATMLLVVSVALIGITALLTVFAGKHKILSKVVYKRFPKVGNFAENALEYMRKTFARNSTLAICFGTGIIIWALFSLKTFFILHILGTGTGIGVSGIITYLSYMAGMIPVSPGGLGIFESTSTLLTGIAGILPDKGIAFTLILRFVTFWFVFILSGFYLAAGRVRRFIVSMRNKRIIEYNGIKE